MASYRNRLGSIEGIVYAGLANLTCLLDFFRQINLNQNVVEFVDLGGFPLILINVCRFLGETEKIKRDKGRKKP